MATAKIEFGLTSTGKASVEGKIETTDEDSIETVKKACDLAKIGFEQELEDFALKKYGKLNKDLRGN